MPGKDLGEYVGDGRPTDPAGEEGLDRHLVGGVEGGWRQLAGAAGLVGEAEARARLEVRGLEVEPGPRRPVDLSGRGAASVAVGQSVRSDESRRGKRGECTCECACVVMS